MSINKVILIGNVGKDPEIRHFENGTPKCTFSLATTETYTNKSGEKISNTEWHNIVIWRGLAEIAQKYVKKGTLLYIEGKIQSRSYDDKDGVKRYITEIITDSMKLLGRRPEDGSSTSTGSGISSQESKATEADDVYTPVIEENNDLPF